MAYEAVRDATGCIVVDTNDASNKTGSGNQRPNPKRFYLSVCLLILSFVAFIGLISSAGISLWFVPLLIVACVSGIVCGGWNSKRYLTRR